MSLLLPFAEPDLAPPALGEPLLDHVEEFEGFDGAFDIIRDTVNLGIHQLNHLPGCDLPTLPEESLEELLVLPFSGDYRRIRQSAEACETLARGFHGWAGDVRRLSLAVVPSWEGDAARACAGRLALWSTAADAAGAVIADGAVVFEGLATFVERIAVQVEGLLVQLAHALERLAKRIAIKLAGVSGAVSMAIDVACHGLDVVTDLIDDVQLVLGLIDQVRAIVEEVRSFVDRTRDSLRGFEQLPDLVRDVLTDPAVHGALP